MFLPHLEHLPTFLSFSPDGFQFTCIFPLAKVQVRRCRNPVNKNDRQSATALREHILNLDPFEDGLDVSLQQYVQLCCCVRYHRTQISDIALLKHLCRRWKKELCSAYTTEDESQPAPGTTRKIKPTVKEESEGSKTYSDSDFKRCDDSQHPDRGLSAARTDTAKWACTQILQKQLVDTVSRIDKAIKDLKAVRDGVQGQLADIPEDIGFRKTSRKSRYASSSRTIETRSTTGSLPWSFTPRPLPSEKSMLKALTDQVRDSGSKSGLIYLYTRKSDPGFIKVGYTTRSSTKRLREWEDSCNYKPILLVESERVPNVARAELLIKKELALGGHWRRETYCKHNKLCYTEHKEWFEVSLETATEVVRRWTNWMRDAAPYDAFGQLEEFWELWFGVLSHFVVPIRSSCLLEGQWISDQDNPSRTSQSLKSHLVQYCVN